MSGGYFGYGVDPGEACGMMEDAELNAMWADLFRTGEFSPRDYGGLWTALDFWLEDDISKEEYLGYVRAFKRKWMRRSQKAVKEFYADALQKECDRMKGEMLCAVPEEDD